MHFELAQNEKENLSSLISPEGGRNPIISLSELEALCEGNDILEELLGNMLKSCLDYTLTVVDFKKKLSESKGNVTEEVKDVDTLRRSVHNRNIADVNIFSRTLAKYNKDNNWMFDGGMDGQNRAAYGKFALTLTLSRI